jgi:hypothetical protein
MRSILSPAGKTRRPGRFVGQNRAKSSFNAARPRRFLSLWMGFPL